MDATNGQGFEERMSQWIASQGFWFQLRHSMSSGGGFSMALFHLMRLGLRVLLVVALAAAGFGVYLVKRVKSAGFHAEFRQGIEEAFHAQEAKVVDFKRVAGEAMIRRLGMVGSEESFFQSFEAGNLRFKMGLLAGLQPEWEAGVIEGNWLDVELKAGAESEASGVDAAESFFADRAGFRVRGVEFSNAKVSWGYHDNTFGQVEGARLKGLRQDGGWRFTFTGGRFSQSWLKELEIEEMVVLCTPERLIFEKGAFRSGGGLVRLQDVSVVCGEYPRVSGEVTLDGVEVRSLLPDRVKGFLNGQLSGVLQLSGSTNSPEGILFHGRMGLGGADHVMMRSELPLLGALDVVDVFNNYKRVVFDDGDFDISTRRGEMEFRNIDLVAEGLVSMRGGFTVRNPTGSELERMVGAETLDVARLGSEGMLRVPEASLKLAAASGRRESEEVGDSKEFFEEIAEDRELRRQEAERAKRLLFFTGELQLELPADAFNRSPQLKAAYPVDANGNLLLKVPLDEDLSLLTAKAARELLTLADFRK